MEEHTTTELSIELDEKTANGVYSNLAVINHSHTEFVIDFVSVMPGVPKAKVQSRIILTPQNTKRLLKALADNLQKFEKSYGIVEEEVSTNSIPLFGQQGKA